MKPCQSIRRTRGSQFPPRDTESIRYVHQHRVGKVNIAVRNEHVGKYGGNPNLIGLHDQRQHDCFITAADAVGHG